MKTDSDYLVDSIADIKQLVTGLIVLNQGLRKRVLDLEENRKVEIEKHEELEVEWSDLRDKHKALRLAKVIEGNNKDKAEREVAELMREIEQCIALVKKM